MTIQTSRLELIPATAALIRLEINNPAALGLALNAQVSPDWPPEEVRDVLPFFAMQAETQVEDWGIFYWVTQAEPRVLVGSGGFKGGPGSGGLVEIGYGTLTEFQGRGYATEAARGLAEFALSQPGIVSVVADALPENRPSVRVLEKSGFIEIGPGAEAGTCRYVYRRPDEAFI